MKVTITKEVELSTLDKSELMQVDTSIIVAEILELRQTIQALKEPTKVNGNIEDATVLTDAAKPTGVEVSEQFSDDVMHRSNGQTGIKRGKTSKFHYLHKVAGQNRWTGKIGDHYVCHESDEVAAALAVDAYLDEVEDTDRPRNRDEFPEVMAAKEEG